MPEWTVPSAGTVSRRQILAGGAGVGVGLASGCLQRVKGIAARPSPEQVSLSIKTLPADADTPSTRIARRLSRHLGAVGIDAGIALLPEAELRRDVLTEGEFDLYVDQMPVEPDPDFLRPRLASVLAGESGWQNPFGLADFELDEILTEQRRSSGRARRAQVDALQAEFARLQPFACVAVPNEISAVRTDRFRNWGAAGPSSPLSYLALEPARNGTVDRLRLAVTDARITENLNPLAAEFRHRGTFTGLVYDSLGVRYGGEVRPWLAQGWEQLGGDRATALAVRLREGATWHDGRALTAEDVGFTYRFLRDTSLGGREAPVPAPRFRGRTSLVESVTVVDDSEVRLEFGETAPAVAARALTVPILPAHVWRSKSAEAELAGVGVNRFVTEGLVWPNPEPIGSGPLAFAESVDREALILERFDDHFLRWESPAPAETFAGGVPFRELSARVAPSDDAAVALVAADEADATVASTDPGAVPRIGRDPTLGLVVDRAPALYHVGFNTDRDPLGNPHFRRAVARLIDPAFVVEEIFDGFARPAATPLAGTDWAAPSLEWRGDDPEVPFVGDDGQLDAPAARDLFREAGFRYDEQGRLLAG